MGRSEVWAKRRNIEGGHCLKGGREMGESFHYAENGKENWRGIRRKS